VLDLLIMASSVVKESVHFGKEMVTGRISVGPDRLLIVGRAPLPNPELTLRGV